MDAMVGAGNCTVHPLLRDRDEAYPSQSPILLLLSKSAQLLGHFQLMSRREVSSVEYGVRLLLQLLAVDLRPADVQQVVRSGVLPSLLSALSRQGHATEAVPGFKTGKVAVPPLATHLWHSLLYLVSACLLHAGDQLQEVSDSLQPLQDLVLANMLLLAATPELEVLPS
jgi:hypothetical protein